MPNSSTKPDAENKLASAREERPAVIEPAPVEPPASEIIEAPAPSLVGTRFVTHMWYYALPSERLQAGAMTGKTMLGKPVLIGRRADGQVFALEDICPHQAVPLSAGKFDGTDVECPFHGWTFDSSGGCTGIPSLVSCQRTNLCSIRTKSYLCREDRGGIWVYFGNRPEEAPEIPRAPGLEGLPCASTTTTLILPNHIDYNVVALIDTAHVPFVHNSWWWRSSHQMKEKVKHYLPDGNGWKIERHQPSKHSLVYRLIGDQLEDEISFRLPGCRLEKIILNGRPLISGITSLTPIDEHSTELNHTTYWTVPGIAPLVTPFVRYFVRTFLMQDKRMAELQARGLKHDPKLIMTIKDAGTPGRWYFDLKRSWNEAALSGQPFVNPIKPTELKWRT